MTLKTLSLVIAALGLAHTASAQISGFSASNTAPAALIQSAKVALAANDTTALKSIFASNPQSYLQLASSLATSNAGDATKIAAAAADAFPSKSAAIASLISAKVPAQRASIYSALGVAQPAGFPAPRIVIRDDAIIISPSR